MMDERYTDENMDKKTEDGGQMPYSEIVPVGEEKKASWKVKRAKKGGKAPKGPRSMKKRWAVLVAMALVFGAVAGGTAFGVNVAASQVYNRKAAENGISNTETVSGTDSTDSTGTVAQVAENAMPSLVTISTMSVEEMRSFFGGTQEYEVEGAGTGVIVGKNDTELLIATNNHVVEGADSLSVGFVDETAVEGQIKGTDATNDLAVVAVKLSERSNASGPSNCRAEAETGGHCHEETGSPVPSPSGSEPMTHQPSSSQVMGWRWTTLP